MRVVAVLQTPLPFQFCVAAVLANVGALWIVKRRKAMHNSFGILCVSHAVGDAIGAFIQFLWSVPVLPFVRRNIWSQTALYVIGELVMVFFFIVLLSHTVKAVNRLVAIASPAFYYLTFKMRKTCVVVGLIWTLPFLRCLTFVAKDCHNWFDNENFVWTSHSTECAYAVYFYMDIVFADTLLGILVFCDIITFICLRRYYRNVGQTRKVAFEKTVTVTTIPTSATTASSRPLVDTKSLARERFWKDFRFFIQGVFVGALYLALTLFNLLQAQVDDSQIVQRLARGALLWILVSVFNGAVVVVFNLDLK